MSESFANKPNTGPVATLGEPLAWAHIVAGTMYCLKQSPPSDDEIDQWTPLYSADGVEALRSDRDQWRESAAGYGGDAELLRDALRKVVTGADAINDDVGSAANRELWCIGIAAARAAVADIDGRS